MKLIETTDGSHTLERTDGAESYHSKHGAIEESKHVFIEAGLASFLKENEEFGSRMKRRRLHNTPDRLSGLQARPSQTKNRSLLPVNEEFESRMKRRILHIPGRLSGLQARPSQTKNRSLLPVNEDFWSRMKRRRLRNSPDRLSGLQARPSQTQNRSLLPVNEEFESRMKRRMKSAEPVRILEVGFGTGLNALLSAVFSEEHRFPIHYTALELFPISESVWKQLNYEQELSSKPGLFSGLHNCDWETDVQISETFRLHKSCCSLLDYPQVDPVDIVYFDAFSPETEPELWTEAVFEYLYDRLSPGGVLVSYCCKGTVKEALRHAGFELQRLAGPAGKRHMLRARKTDSND